MQKYVFILGKSPELSLAEIASIWPDSKISLQGPDFAVLDGISMAPQEAQERLGGVIKVGIVIDTKLDKKALKEHILASSSPSGRRNFGFSWYGTKPDKRLGMELKKQLKSEGIGCRLVESREPQLSAVIISKEKCRDFMVLADGKGGVLVAQTMAVQDFRDYSQRDFGRPRSDAVSGMLPPKLAKMMVNLAQVSTDDLLLDPFCGSGTILAEALALGYGHLKGCDLSSKAVDDSAANIEWLAGRLGISKYDCEVFACDVRKLSERLAAGSVGAIVTEPYLGKPIKGFEREAEIKGIIAELEQLYIEAFRQFKKVLGKAGRAVVIIPEWHIGGKVFRMRIFKEVEEMGFKREDAGNLIYKRENQKVWRNVTVWSI